MELPYSIEVYRAALAGFNAHWFPLPVVMPLVLAAVAAAVVKAKRRRDALTGYPLALVCLWVGWGHQLDLMAAFDFLAPIYGGAWIAQGVLLAVACGLLGEVRFMPRAAPVTAAAAAVFALGLIGYPLLAYATGTPFDGLPVAGMAPTPTAVALSGLLIVAGGRWSLFVWLIPLLWAGVAASTGNLLDYWPDMAAAAVIAAAAAVHVLGPRWTR
jgi:hypothetical protein